MRCRIVIPREWRAGRDGRRRVIWFVGFTPRIKVGKLMFRGGRRCRTNSGCLPFGGNYDTPKKTRSTSTKT